MLIAIEYMIAREADASLTEYSLDLFAMGNIRITAASILNYIDVSTLKVG